jgi:hypothetical protein
MLLPRSGSTRKSRGGLVSLVAASESVAAAKVIAAMYEGRDIVNFERAARLEGHDFRQNESLRRKPVAMAWSGNG